MSPLLESGDATPLEALGWSRDTKPMTNQARAGLDLNLTKSWDSLGPAHRRVARTSTHAGRWEEGGLTSTNTTFLWIGEVAGRGVCG